MTQSFIHQFLFGIYPYLCITILLLGSLIRFEREQYTWKSASSQLLRRGQLRLGSNLFHAGILIVIAGHFVGFLAPHWMVAPFMDAARHQWLAMVVGGAAGIVALLGLSILAQRRWFEPRVRRHSSKSDLLVLGLLWVQLALGLATIPASLSHMDGAMFEMLSGYIKGIATLQPGAAAMLVSAPLVYKVHIAVGFTLFLISPFTRLVHVWSGAATLAYLARPYQIVRKR